MDCQIEEPRLDRPVAREGRMQRHLLALARVHNNSVLGGCPIIVQTEIQRLDVVEALGQMLHNQLRVRALTQNIEQICRCHKVEAGEGQTLGLEVV